jgi:hypothetical protein
MPDDLMDFGKSEFPNDIFLPQQEMVFFDIFTGVQGFGTSFDNPAFVSAHSGRFGNMNSILRTRGFLFP